MANLKRSDLTISTDGGDLFDPVVNPDIFTGITIRRIVAYLIDVLIMGAVMFVIFAAVSFTFSNYNLTLLMLVVMIYFVPLIYHTVLIGGPRAATVGMGIMGIEVRRMDGGHLNYQQAGFLTVVFYVSANVTGWLILLVALFNRRGRTFHDYLCSMVIIRNRPVIEVLGSGSWPSPRQSGRRRRARTP